MYIKQVCVPSEDVYTFYRKLQLSDSSTEPYWVTKVNWTLAALANLFLGQTCGFTNAACWKKTNKKHLFIQKEYCQLRAIHDTTDHHYSVLFYCFHPCAGAWFFGFVKKISLVPCSKSAEVKGDTLFYVFVLLAKRIASWLLAVAWSWQRCALHRWLNTARAQKGYQLLPVSRKSSLLLWKDVLPDSRRANPDVLILFWKDCMNDTCHWSLLLPPGREKADLM